jgi:hypothetical protein
MLRFYNTPESKTRTKALHKEPHPISSLRCAIPPGKSLLVTNSVISPSSDTKVHFSVVD